MFVYVGRTYTATLRGSRIVPVTCERCQSRFAYELTRVGVGRASAPYYIGQDAAADRAEKAAKKGLARRLQRESEMVPCPECQWVNGDLIAQYRRRKYRPFRWIAAGIAVVGVFIALSEMYVDKRQVPSGGMQVFLGICLLAAAAVLLFQHWLRRRIDPNRGGTGGPVLPPGTPPALVERPDPAGGPSRSSRSGARRSSRPARSSGWCSGRIRSHFRTFVACVSTRRRWPTSPPSSSRRSVSWTCRYAARAPRRCAIDGGSSR